MPQLLRIVLDAVVTDDEDMPNQYRLQELATEASQNLHVTIAEREDGLNMAVEKLATTHVHDSTNGPCQYCVNMGYDERNGASVMEESGVSA